jgi:DDE superfamily endonuclease
MQHGQKLGVLCRRLNTLQRYLALRWRDSCIKLKVGVIVEIRRLQEQLIMQASFRRRIMMSSFNINTLSDHECLSRFRFKRRDVGFISEIIGYEATGHENGRTKTARRRYRTDPVEATAIFLRRLGSPSRWVDLQLEFGKHIAALTEIFYHTLELFYSTLGTKLETWPDRLVASRAAYYSQCVTEKGSLLPNVVGFIDGTAIEIARPSGLSQRATYSGHKRRNCIKFQAISAPDGLILHLFGPMEGRRHDMTLYRASQIDGVLQHSLLINEIQYYLYGDAAYCLRPYLQTGYHGSTLNMEQIQFNMSMSRLRIAVEWAFRDIKTYFTHIDLPRKLKLGITPVGLWYICSAVLWNFRVSFYGSQAAQYFDCHPLSIEDFLSYME